MSTFTYPAISVSSALAPGAATEAKQDSIISELQLKADLTETQPVSAASLPLPTGAATQTTLASLLTELELKADSSETQPVSAVSLPLPTGAATEATLITIDADTSSIATDSSTIASDTTSINGKITACDTGSVTISSALPPGTNTIGNVNLNELSIVDFLDTGLLDSSASNITTAGLQIISSLAANVSQIDIFEDIGEFMAITDGSDVVLAYLPLGGGSVKVSIPSGTVLKLASLTGSSITVGKISMNLLG